VHTLSFYCILNDFDCKVKNVGGIQKILQKWEDRDEKSITKNPSMYDHMTMI